MSFLGKIPAANFDQVILPRCGSVRKTVVAGPAFGVDVSVVSLPGGMGLAMASDPLSLIPSLGLQESAWLSVQLVANDIATTGFGPMYAQMVLNLPPTLPEKDLTVYWNHIHQYCENIGVSITGGHTCSIEGQNSTICGGSTMITTAQLTDIRLSKYAKAGDNIIVTKQCALSSSAILAMSFPETVKNKLGKEVYEQGCELFYQTSCLMDGLVAGATTSVTAMHDATEGGVLGAVYEMAIASGNGIRIINEALPLGIPQIAICDLFGIDARYCVGAGAMIIAADKTAVTDILKQLKENNIEACVIGEFTERAKGYILEENGVETTLFYHHTDPYWEAFFEAYNRGWK
jgi:hydrogenase maturation factor